MESNHFIGWPDSTKELSKLIISGTYQEWLEAKSELINLINQYQSLIITGEGITPELIDALLEINLRIVAIENEIIKNLN